jgi:hypothetical protein
LSGPVPTEYEEVVVDESNAILPDTTLSSSGDYLYVLSTSKVRCQTLSTFVSSGTLQISKINVEHCSSYNNCSACLESKDPYCGWCSLEKK